MDIAEPGLRVRRAKPMLSLTGVRGAAAFWVFLGHMSHLLGFLFFLPALGRYIFFTNSYRGVDLFFILSGFILMHVHAHEFTTFDSSRLRDFYITRFFRIYPINGFVLLLMVPLVLLFPGYVAFMRHFTDPHFAYKIHNFSAAGLLQSLLLAQSWTVVKLGEWNVPAWTLSAEVVGYAFFPIMAWRLMKVDAAWRGIVYAGISLAVLTCLLVMFGHAENDPTGSFGTVRMAFCFFAGVCAYRSFMLLGADFQPWASPVTLLAVLFLGLTMLAPVAPLLDAFGFAALIFGLGHGTGPVDRLLTTRPAMLMGKISFSFYLTHLLLIEFFFWAFAATLRQRSIPDRVVSVLGLVVMCFLLATLLYVSIEKPFQRLGKRMIRDWRARAPRPVEMIVGK